MKILAVALCLILSTCVKAAQSNAAPAPDSAVSAVQSKIDPAKEADIRHLMEVVGTAGLVRQLMGSVEQTLKPTLVNALPPGDYREKLADLFFEKFHSKFDIQHLLDLAVARYDENFSDEEIKGLIKFYETPLGQKVITALPKLTAELQQDGQKLGRQMGRDAMIEVLSEHPDIARALQDASHGASPASR